MESIKKNYTYNLIYQIVVLIAPFITTPYVSRVLGADGIGTYSYTNAINSYFVLFAVFGTAIYGQREIAAYRDDKKKYSLFFWELTVLRFLTTALTLIVYAIFVFASGEYTVLYIILAGTIISNTLDISWFFMAHEQFRITVTRSLLVKIISIILIFLLVGDEGDLYLYVAIMTFSTLIGNMLLWFYLPKYLVKIEWKNISVKKHFKATLIYFAPTLAASGYTALDKVVLGIVTDSNYENGYYEQAHKVISMCLAVVSSMNAVMRSRMSYLFIQKKYIEIQQRLHKSIRFVMILSLPMMVGICTITDSFVPCFFGEGYEKCIVLIRIFSVLFVVLGLSNCLTSQYYTPGGLRKKVLQVTIINLLFNLVLNILLIPSYLSVGAAVASVAAETLGLIIYCCMERRHIKMISALLPCWKYVIASLIMMIISLFIGNTHILGNYIFVLQIIAGVIVYFGALLLMKDSFLLAYVFQAKEKLIDLRKGKRSQ